MRHGLRPPVPLCRSRRSVARKRPVRADDALRHRASNPFAGGFPKTSVIFVQIPVMARPRASSGIPLCNSGEGCVGKRTVSPPATYAVQRFPVRPPAAIPAWGGRVSARHRMPLCGFPMRPKGHLLGKSGDRAPRGVRSPHWSSRVAQVHSTNRIPSFAKSGRQGRDHRSNGPGAEVRSQSASFSVLSSACRRTS
jgi:hypothetical protein